jgi:hypothetical protein
MSVEIIVHECECDACKAGFEQHIVKGHQRINLFLSCLNEPQRRWYVATLSEDDNALSDRQLSLITGLDEKTIRRGKAELQEQLTNVPAEQQRRSGGGRLRAEKKTRS